MSTRFSEPEATAIDAARGNADRSEWLRTAALAYLAAGGRKVPRPVTTAAPPRAPVPPKSTALPKQPPAGKPADCPHRLQVGAWCKTCGRTKT